MVSSRTHCCVARLDEAASQRCAQRRFALMGQPLVGLVARRIAACVLATSFEGCGKTWWRAGRAINSQSAGRRAFARASDLATGVHARSSRTRHGGILTIRYGRDDQQICSRCRKPQHTSTANHWLAKLNRTAVAARNNHDARRNDDATYRKTRKNVINLRAPTARTEVRVASREGVQSRS